MISHHWIFTFFASFNIALAAKEIPVVHIEAVAGNAVLLPCDISINNPSKSDHPDSVALVLWYKESLGTPIYSVDLREREGWKHADKWSDDNVFADRANFLPDTQPAQLKVDYVTEVDAGLYRCRVDFRVAQTRNSRVNLTVIVPPHKMVIVDDKGAEKNNFVGPYEEGADLRLTCRVYGGSPQPIVFWTKGEEMLSNMSSAPLNHGGQVENHLVIHSLKRTDLRSELTCTAYNNNKSRIVSTVHVDMNFKPLDVAILGNSQPLSAGRRYELICQSNGSRPHAKITWWKNTQRLDRTKEQTANDGYTTQSTLSFVASKDDDGKNLSCRAENPALSAESLIDNWTLQIHYVPETEILLGKSLNPVNIREGSDVYFDCLVDAEPPVYKVEWKHNGKQLSHNIAHGVIISNQSLVLQSVSRNSAGNYSCVGFNTEGDGESKSFFLNVLFAPTCKPNQTRVHGVAKQERANISCQVDANPPQVTFRWMFNNSAETMDVDSNRIIKRPGAASIVTYTPMTELDYGTLLCWASNRIGKQRTPCVYHIIAAGKPDTVHNCSVSNASLSSVTVRCAEGFNGGLPQSFVLEVREAGTHNIAANLTAPLPRFTVHGLGPGQDYQASVFAYNVKGRSEPVILQTATLRLPEKQLTTDKGGGLLVGAGWRLTPVMMVVVGVAGALFLVACLVAGLLRLQCSREDSRKVREQQAKQNSPIAKAPTTPTLDSDPDRNPDVIPNTGLDEEEREFLRKRQLVSTIETRGSPTRSLLHHPYPAGYCTLRNGGLPLQDLSNIPTKPPPNPQVVFVRQQDKCVVQLSPTSSSRGLSFDYERWNSERDLSEGVWSTTLPRQWPGAIPAVAPMGGYQAPMPRQPQPADSAPQTPLVQHKRESQV